MDKVRMVGGGILATVLLLAALSCAAPPPPAVTWGTVALTEGNVLTVVSPRGLDPGPVQ